ncbi:MAG: hypothetical protein KF805_08500 [Phycisphaeraceae bacterium]|nr:hypothetical protein [Phycisphaeraceae bacterium]
MAETLFMIAGWGLLIGGVLVAWRFGWRDAGKGTRRCPKCWYDMSATAGLQCPECGRDAKGERRLFRRRRKWRWVGAGLLLGLASYPVFKWPLYQKDGLIGFVPRAVTLALLPEISELIREHGPRGAPSGNILALKLSQAQSFNLMERYAYARAVRRALASSDSSKRKAESLWSASLLGDQAGEVVDPLIVLLSSKSSAAYAADFASSLPRVRDERFARLIAPIRAFVERTGGHPGFPGNLEERMRWWGASREDCRAVTASILRASKPTGNVDHLLEFIWLFDCASPESLCDLEKQLSNPSMHASMFAAMCLADLGLAGAPAIDEIVAETKKPSSSLVNAVAMPLMAMGGSARNSLGWLDGLSNHRNPLIASSAFLAALSIRGEADAAYAYWIACIENDSATNPDAPPHQWMTPLILYADVPTDWKVEGLVLAIERDRKQYGKVIGGVSGGELIGVDCLGKLCGDAVASVPALVNLIEPGIPDFFVCRILDALTKIRGGANFDIDPVEEAVARWSLTATGRDGVDAAMADLKDAAARSLP